MKKDEIFNLIKTNSYVEGERIILGNIIELKINENFIDVYKYVNLDTVDENYDFDNDYITTLNMR